MTASTSTDLASLNSGSADMSSVSSEQAVDGHVAGRVGREGRARPVGVAGFEGESGQLSHQVEFGRPDVAVWGPEQFGLGVAFGEVEVVRDDVLLQYVVRVEEDVAGLGD